MWLGFFRTRMSGSLVASVMSVSFMSPLSRCVSTGPGTAAEVSPGRTIADSVWRHCKHPDTTTTSMQSSVYLIVYRVVLLGVDCTSSRSTHDSAPNFSTATMTRPEQIEARGILLGPLMTSRSSSGNYQAHVSLAGQPDVETCLHEKLVRGETAAAWGPKCAETRCSH
jgi:hypothetical protein